MKPHQALVVRAHHPPPKWCITQLIICRTFIFVKYCHMGTSGPKFAVVFKRSFLSHQILGPAFGIFCGFFFLSRRIFRGFSRRIFFPHFCGKSAQKNSLGKSPGKSSKIYTTKSSDTFLQIGRGNRSSLCELPASIISWGTKQAPQRKPVFQAPHGKPQKRLSAQSGCVRRFPACRGRDAAIRRQAPGPGKKRTS